MSLKVSELPTALLAGAAFIVIVAGIQAASAIVIPFLLAISIVSVCAPLLLWLLRRGVPNGLAVLIIVFGLLIAAIMLTVFAGRSLTALARQLPSYQERLAGIITHLITWLNSHGLNIEMDNILVADYFSPGRVMSLITYGLSVLRVLITNMFLILLFVLFILLEITTFAEKLQAAFPDPDTLDHFRTITANINQYLGLKAIISMATGAIIWLLLTLIGVEFAGTWGLLAFFLNFIPSIGSIIAAIPAILWSLVQLGLPAALLTLLAYLIVNITIGNFIDPRIIGRKLGLSTLVVFMSMIFWGWVLGPIGMLLSVPLTMIAKIALATNKDTRWLAVMLE